MSNQQEIPKLGKRKLFSPFHPSIPVFALPPIPVFTL